MYCRKKLFSKKQQIVVLLGAGATMPWKGISSEAIKKIFKQEKVSIYKRRVMGKFIFDIFDRFYRKDCANFETFLAALEEIMNYVISSTNGGGVNKSNTSFIPAILKLKKCINKLLLNKDETGKRKYIYEIFQTYVNILINKIDEYNLNVLNEDYAEKNKNLIRFTKYFLSKNYSVKYYTTNYDNIIPQMLRRDCNIYEGLYDSEWLYDGGKYKRFKYDLGQFRKARLSHFNLHGSIFLRRYIHNAGHGYETVYNTTGSVQMDKDIALTEDGGNPGEKLVFSPIIAGYSKTQRAANQPFSLGFNAFVNDCNDCHALCIVGYSASDPHINTILSSYIHWNNVRFMYVTQENGNFINTEFVKLNNEIVQVIEREKNDMWIHDGRKHIYKKGFEEFLKSKSNWEYLHLK
jgi:hypothetical protein